MPGWTLLLIAVGVSADAFAVAVGKGLQMRQLRVRSALAVAATFGVFQAVMPVIGWALGSQLAPLIAGVDHWVAFGLLLVVGLTMIRAALTDLGDAPRSEGGVGQLLVLGLATSVDALAVGISVALLEVGIFRVALLIGVVTFVLSYAGVVVGHRAGQAFRRPAEAIGGLILIAIGTGILIDHLGAGPSL